MAEAIPILVVTDKFLPLPLKGTDMSRYMVERTFPAGLHIPVNAAGAKVCGSVVENNAKRGVTWVHSYVSEDLGKTFCIYDGPSPESIRRAADCNKLPVTRITEVRQLSPYFFK